jgi:hypothetical protein
MILFQGGTFDEASNTACCPKTAGQCKVQAQGQTGTQYVDAANNRTAQTVGAQAIFNLYNEKKTLVAARNGSAWMCQSYCPLKADDHFENALAFDPAAKDLGRSIVNNKSYEHFQWSDMVLGLKMDTQDWLVDYSGAKPVPFQTTEALTPFGGAQIAESTQKFQFFEAGTGKFNFEVLGLAQCPLDKNCNSNNNNVVESFMSQGNPFMPKKLSAADVFPADKTTKGSDATPAAVASTATWPNDWSATETQTMLINQGGTPDAAGDTCCKADYFSQCQVQSQYQTGVHYYDFTNQRSRFEDPVNGITVNLFGKIMKSMAVVHNGTHDVCQKYCPIEAGDSLDGGKDYFLDRNATDLGKATFQKKAAEHYQWKDMAFGFLTMSTTDFYSDESTTPGKAMPIGLIEKLTPFGGAQIGQSTVNWGNFKAAAQPASKFDIQGVDTCPQDPQGCGQNSKQLLRKAEGLTNTFARYNREA